MNKKNEITKKLKIDYPVIQAPMLGVTTPEMVAEISNNGGLGSLAVGGLSPDATLELIYKTKKLTNKPFAVNLFAHDIPDYNEDLEPMRHFLLGLADSRGYKLTSQDLTGFKFYTYHDQIDILIQENISVVSFTFGCLDKKDIEKLKTKETIIIGTATCLDEAIKLKENNTDMITAQGIEAGGHRGSFTKDKLPEIGLFSLIPQIVNNIDLPLIAAGGINNPETIKAAFTLGANAIQVGSAFIATKESKAILSYQNRLSYIKDTDTILTRAFSGRWARGIKNEFIEALQNSGLKIPPYPIQNSLTEKFRKLAQQNNDCEYTNMWAGQSAKSQKIKSTKEVFNFLISEL